MPAHALATRSQSRKQEQFSPTQTPIKVQRTSERHPSTVHPTGRCACGGGCPTCRSKLQAKLVIGPVNDPLEREADHIAELVTAPGNLFAPVLTSSSGAGSLQRACACGGKCGCSKELEAEEPLQRKATTTTPERAPSSVEAVLASSGRPLPEAIRTDFEPRFGRDLRGVRVHTDPIATQSAADVQALAYTVGYDIVFGAGQFAPDTASGRRLIAHELTHVVQQGAASSAEGRYWPAPLVSVETPEISRQGMSDGVIQRQPAPAPVHRTSPISSGVSSDKWREDAESAYRRAGLSMAANAVRNCRELGNCQTLLTNREAWNAYKTGRVTANLGEPPESGPGKTAPNGGVAMAGMAAAPLLAEGGAAAAKSLAERRALAWGVSRAVPLLVTEAAAATTATATAAAPAAAVGVSTVAVPIAVGVVLVLAVIDLVGWARFQAKLESLGYFILPDPLATCIQNCHTAPAFPSQPKFPFPNPDLFPRRDPFGPRISPDELDKLKDWLDKSAPPTSPIPGLTPTPVPVPVPVPNPKPKQNQPPDVILRLPPQKTFHAARYAALIRSRSLVHQSNNPRTQNAQAGRWDRALRPPIGIMSIRQEIWDRFEAMGVSEARRLRPNWSQLTFFNVPMQVDHIVELQVCPPGQEAIWDSFANYELLDQASNGSSGPLLAANIRAERVRLAAVTGNPIWLVTDLVFTQLELMPGPGGERWQADEIQQGLHYHARRRLLGETR